MSSLVLVRRFSRLSWRRSFGRSWTCSPLCSFSTPPPPSPPPTVSSSTSRDFSKVSDSSVVEKYLEDVYGEEDPLTSYSVRQTQYDCYPDESDPSHRALLSADSHEEVFQIVSDLDPPEPRHLVQALVALRHCHKWIGDRHSQAEYVEDLKASKEFEEILEGLLPRLDEVSLANQGYALLSLRNLGVPLTDPLAREIQVKMTRNREQLELENLSCLAVSIRGTNNTVESAIRDTSLTRCLMLAPCLPKLRALICDMETVQEVHQAAIVIHCVSKVASDDLMELFLAKIFELKDKGVFEQDNEMTIPALVKVLSLSLTKKDWFLQRAHYTRELLWMLKGRLSMFAPMKVIVVSKVASRVLEPAPVVQEVKDRLLQMYNEGWEVKDEFVKKINVLQALTQMKGGGNIPKSEILALVKESLESRDWKWNFNSVLDVIRHTSMIDAETHGLFFRRALELSKEDGFDLRRMAIRYSQFSTVVNMNIRDEEYERTMVDIFDRTINDTVFVGRFCSEFAFLLCYQKRVRKATVESFNKMSKRMQPISMYLISVIIGSFTPAQMRELDREKAQLIRRVAEAVYARGIELIKTDLHLPDKILILRSFINMKSLKMVNEVADVIEEVFADVDVSKLSMNVVRDLTQSLSMTKMHHNVPNLLNSLVRYFLANKDSVLHLNIQKLVYLCYSTNHRLSSENETEILQLCNDHLLNNMDAMNGRHVLNACTALLFYKSLSREVVSRVFCKNFMAKLDDEIAVVYTKDSTYPIVVRELLMDVNRSVCLLYPEYGVPWLHDSFCQQNPYRYAETHREFERDVHHQLCAAAGGREYVRRDVFTPFYHYVPFEVVFGRDGEPVPAADRDFDVVTRRSAPAEEGQRRVAVLTHRVSMVKDNQSANNGNSQMRVDLTELQGYQVVQIHLMDWRSLGLSSSQEKKEFLKRKLAEAVSS